MIFAGSAGGPTGEFEARTQQRAGEDASASGLTTLSARPRQDAKAIRVNELL